MNFAVHVEIRGLEGLADPEGRTIERALPALGFEGASEVRVGKVISFSLEAEDQDAAERSVEAMCAQLLANPVMQRAEITVTPGGA